MLFQLLMRFAAVLVLFNFKEYPFTILVRTAFIVMPPIISKLFSYFVIPNLESQSMREMF